MVTLEDLAQALRWSTRSMHFHPDVNWLDAMSWAQLGSKIWLIQELGTLDRHLGTILIVGGWLGVLPLLVFTDGRLSFDCIRSIDRDPSCEDAANMLNRLKVLDGWKFRAATADAMTIDYTRVRLRSRRDDGDEVTLEFRPDTVINTAWEHFPDPGAWFARLPRGTFVALQASGDPSYEDHVSTPASLDEFRRAAPLSTLLFSGTRVLNMQPRHMLLGIV